MEWNGSRVRPCCRDKLAILKVCQCALDCAPGEARGRGDRLMGHAHRPVRLLGRETIEEEVNDERRQSPIMAHEVRQKAVEQVGVKGYLYHSSL